MRKTFISFLVLLCASLTVAMTQSEGKQSFKQPTSSLSVIKNKKNDEASDIKTLKESTTSLITKELVKKKSWQVGWHTDKRICTSLEGAQKGFQVIIQNGRVVDKSKTFEVKEGFVIHTYSWGKVYTSPSLQSVKVTNSS
jgi:hypothetical protein